ncbi:helix-turn-helix domain-containing protein [Sphingobacterium siyangense]|jgi:transcriptional regulator with XRE-family HTH domain|uniref:helix-turn-helix domain-containing protein n=1 Tax=Sphingobacterium siyangense TaxID=459529 RepID=UPI003DA5EFC2
MSKKINNIKKAIKDSPLQVVALALYLDVDDTTISKWNSNTAQPSLKRLDEVGEILEVDNVELIQSIPRNSTGLAQALQNEYKRLLKTGMSIKIQSPDDKGELKEINNPEFVRALQKFVADYKKEKL